MFKLFSIFTYECCCNLNKDINFVCKGFHPIIKKKKLSHNDEYFLKLCQEI